MADKFSLNLKNYSLMRRSRVVSMQILYLVEFYESKKALEGVFIEVFDLIKENEGVEDLTKIINLEFVKDVVEKAILDKKESLAIIKENMKQEKNLDNPDSNLILILRLALAEIKLAKADIPVIINEYIEVTKIFESEKEAKFVNGILDGISKNG